MDYVATDRYDGEIHSAPIQNFLELDIIGDAFPELRDRYKEEGLYDPNAPKKPRKRKGAS